ncbi:MAG: FecR domain-containing protein [Phycisphaeraceae bacterium]
MKTTQPFVSLFRAALALTLAMSLSVVASALQDKPPVAPAPAAVDAPAVAAAADSLKIQIVAIEGMVQIRPGADQPWQRATVGMELKVGWDIRTSIRSAVQFTIDGNHTVTVDSFGDVRVLEAIRKDGKVKTDVGMRYGRTEYKVEVAAEEHEARIHTPSATLAIRGSTAAVQDNQLGCQVVVTESHLSQVNGRGGFIPPTFLAKGQVNVDNKTQKKEGPGQHLKKKNSLDGGSDYGKTGVEEGLRGEFAANVNQGQNGGFNGNRQRLAENNSPRPNDRIFTSFNFFKDVPNDNGGTPPQGTAPGSLVAFLDFSSMYSNLDLVLTLPNGGTIATNSSLGPTSVSLPVQGFASGSAIIFDNGVQTGSYGATVNYTSGGIETPVGFTLDVIQFAPNASTGHLIKQFTGSVSSSNPTATTTFNVGQPQTGGSVPNPVGNN